MKMKRLCESTGLSERTIRFYMEKGLLVPASNEKNGRIFFDFDEGDILQLRRIAALRKAEFSIDDILQMQRDPTQIDKVVELQARRLQSEAEHYQRVAGLLKTLGSVGSCASLADQLLQPTAPLSLPPADLSPNFGQFDSETREQKDAAHAAFLEGQQRSYRLGKGIVLTIAAVNALVAIFSSVVQFSFLTLCFQLVLSFALVFGISWAKVFSIIQFASVCIVVLTLFFQSDGVPLPPVLVISMAVQFVYSLACCILLLKSKAVNDYLYTQKNG